MKKNIIKKPQIDALIASEPFSGKGLEIYSVDGERWIRSSEIGRALEYNHPDRAISDVFKRNEDEFTPNMTRLMPMQTAGGVQEVRVFSLRGAHMLAMLARSTKAKEFRGWLLDLIEREEIRPALQQEALVLHCQAEKGVQLRDMMGAMAEGHQKLTPDAITWVFGHARDDLDNMQQFVSEVAESLEIGGEEREIIHALEV